MLNNNNNNIVIIIIIRKLQLGGSQRTTAAALADGALGFLVEPRGGVVRSFRILKQPAAGPKVVSPRDTAGCLGFLVLARDVGGRGFHR